MVTVDASATAVDGVTLVTVTLTGDGVARRVRVEQQLDGPVWPPRREGRPADGWDERGYEGVVPADERLALGYATPAPPAESPVAITEKEPASEDTDGRPTEPAEVVRMLGDPAPPRDAVPLPAESRSASETASDGPTSGRETGGVAAATGSETADCPSANDSDSSECRMSLRRDSQQYESASGLSADDATATGAAGDSHAKTPVAAWFERVEGRLATVERLGEVDTVPTATAALRAAGGLEGARETARAVEADRRRLLAVAQRAQVLAARAEAVDVPVATLERLA
jgi:hypothetical protein